MLDRRLACAIARGRRGREGEVDRHGRDRPQCPARRRRHRGSGDRSGRADHPAGRRLPIAHPRAGDPPEQGGDPRHLRARAGRRRPDGRSRSAHRGRAVAPPREVPVGADGGERRELRGGRDRQRLRVRVGGQRPDVHDAARGARDGDGHREGGPELARHGGVPAAAAAVVYCGAVEPVHVLLERRRGSNGER